MKTRPALVGGLAVYRFRDDLDLDGVADDLAKADWKAEEVDDGTHLTMDLTSAESTTGLVDDRYPLLGFADVTILPGRHLMVASMGSDLGTAVRGAASGDDSLADRKSLAGLADGSPLAAEIAAPLDCGASSSTMTPAQLAAAASGAGLEGLGKPEAAAIAVEDDQAVASLSFADDGAASSDAKARRDYLAHGTSTVSGQPMSHLISDAEVTTDGSVVRSTFRMQGPAYRALDFLTRDSDGPVACGP